MSAWLQRPSSCRPAIPIPSSPNSSPVVPTSPRRRPCLPCPSSASRAGTRPRTRPSTTTGAISAPARASSPTMCPSCRLVPGRNMKRARVAATLGAFAWVLAGLAHAAVPYIQSPPLTQVVKSPVGAVAAGPVQVPIITWGGDIATIHANGNTKATARNSIFGKQGLNLNLVREDVFAKQVEAYMSGKSPYLRGTLGMVNMAAEVTSKDPRTKPVVIYQLTWSSGGDALVVKGNVKSTKDLKGKAVAVQAYGPHVDYLAKVLSDAGLSMKDVTIKWVSDITGGSKSPAAALREGTVDAAMVIIPDALALTS